MRTVTISFVKNDIISLFRSKVFKVAESLANDQNFKAIFNIKHGGAEDIVDTRISDGLYSNRLGLLYTIIADYIVQNTQTGVTLNLPSTSTATEAVLTAAAKEYVSDGMLADWMRIVAPQQSKQYDVTAALSEDNIRRIVYSKKAPTP